MLACDGNDTSVQLALADGWVRGMPPGMNMTAAYGRFVNLGDSAIEIVAIESDSFASVSLHQTTAEAGTSRMKPVIAWSIEPGATAVLEPGGLHLMMMQPTRELVVGSTVELTLTSNSGQSYHFTLKVEAR
jgi:periplasmic copper chaperone A